MSVHFSSMRNPYVHISRLVSGKTLKLFSHCPVLASVFSLNGHLQTGSPGQRRRTAHNLKVPWLLGFPLFVTTLCACATAPQHQPSITPLSGMTLLCKWFVYKNYESWPKCWRTLTKLFIWTTYHHWSTLTLIHTKFIGIRLPEHNQDSTLKRPHYISGLKWTRTRRLTQVLDTVRSAAIGPDSKSFKKP